MNRRPARWALLLVAAVSGGLHAESTAVRPLYSKQSSFGIPFRVDTAQLEQLRSNELRLYVSDDQGKHWAMHSSVEPSAGRFVWEAHRDGEYWFAVRTVDHRGRLHPNEGQAMRAELRVVVDTKPPVLVLAPASGNGGAAVQWQADDLNLNAESLSIEYAVQAAGQDAHALQWQTAETAVGAGRIGSVHTGQAKLPENITGVILVRAEVRDSANNVGKGETRLVARGGATTSVETPAPGTGGLAGDGAAVGTQRPNASSNRSIDLEASRQGDAAPSQGGIERRGVSNQQPVVGDGPLEEPQESRPQVSAPPHRRAVPIIPPMVTRQRRTAATPQTAPPQGRVVERRTPKLPQITAGNGVQLLNSTKFEIQYALDSVGPSGIGSVDLWVTRDRGETWSRYGTDRDRKSPFPVDVGAGNQGPFGFSLVVTSGSGISAPPPGRGEAPQVQVWIDSVPPRARLLRPEIGSDRQGPYVLIHWEAQDANPAAAPVSLAWAPSATGPWTTIAEGLKNTASTGGTYQWRNPGISAGGVFLRLQVRDLAGNQTLLTNSIDMAPPRARIIGVRRQ